MEFFDIDTDISARIKVVGVGGGGGNAVNNMIASALKGVTFISANTDAQALARSQAEHKLQIGNKLTKGLGAGANPRMGCEAALESIDHIKELLRDSNMVFVTAGMGGGTGTGAAPVIAQTAKELGILTVGVVTKPFFFEGKRRIESATAGIEELRKHVDSLIIIPNDRLVQLAPKNATFIEMLKRADDVLYYAVKGISDLIMIPGYINLDFADIRAVMSQSGIAMMGTGVASGEARAREAAMKAITSPLLEGVSIDGAHSVIINVTCGPDLTIEEISEAAATVQEAAHTDVNVFFGSVLDESVGDEVRITVIATGIDNAVSQNIAPAKAATVAPIRKPMAQPLAPVESTMPQQPTAGSSTYNIPPYLRKQPTAPAPVTPRASSHSPGEDDFIFNEDELEIPSFVRKQAN